MLARPPGARGDKLPERIEPMLAALAQRIPAAAANYAFEYKWDGMRAMAYLRDRVLSAESRNGIGLLDRFPELRSLPGLARSKNAIFDGELVALDERGSPSFALLQQRMGRFKNTVTPKLIRDVPVCYFVFDLLFFKNRSLLSTPYRQRREMLAAAARESEFLKVPASVVGDGETMLESARAHALEGIVAKRLDGFYEPGLRTGSWLKLKIVQSQEFVIGGWVPEKGDAANGRLGALLLGYYPAAGTGPLVYAGRVGTGFSARQSAELVASLKQLKTADNPFCANPRVPGAIFTDPKLVAQVEYRRWRPDGLVEQASFKGLRPDKNPRDVVREDADPRNK